MNNKIKEIIKKFDGVKIEYINSDNKFETFNFKIQEQQNGKINIKTVNHKIRD